MELNLINTLTKQAIAQLSEKYNVSEVIIELEILKGNIDLFNKLQELVKLGLETVWEHFNKEVK